MDARTRYTSFLVTYYAGVTRDLPTISPYARDLAASSTTPSAAALLTAYATDPFLSAKVCGVANSIFFNQNHQPVFTVQAALDRVGSAYARKLLQEAPKLPAELDASQIGLYWAHCMCVAHNAKHLAATIAHAPCDPDVAYLAGMVHDIGYLLQIHHSLDTLPEVVQALQHGEPGPDNSLHTTQGEELARFWYLPDAAVDVIKSHHGPRPTGDIQAPRLSLLIALSDSLAPPHPRVSAPLEASSPFARSVRDLGISDDIISLVRSEGAKLHDECLRLISLRRPSNSLSSRTRLKVV